MEKPIEKKTSYLQTTNSQVSNEMFQLTVMEF